MPARSSGLLSGAYHPGCSSRERLIPYLDAVETPLCFEDAGLHMVLQQETLRTLPSDAQLGTATMARWSDPVVCVGNEQVAIAAW